MGSALSARVLRIDCASAPKCKHLLCASEEFYPGQEECESEERFTCFGEFAEE